MRKIKFLIGILTLVVMTSLFGLFTSENNNVYAASNPSMTMSVSNTQMAPGREFTISVTADAGSIVNNYTNGELKEWSGVTLTMYFPLESPFTFSTLNVKYNPIGSDNSDLQAIMADGYDLSFADYSEEGYIDAGISYNYETDAFTLDTVQSFEFVFTCKIDEELDPDAPTNFNIEFGGPDDYISMFYIDGDEYSLTYENIDGFDVVQKAEMVVKDKSKNSIFDSLTVTGKETSELWEACDTDADESNNTTTIIDQTLNVAAATDSLTINATAAEQGSIYSVSPSTGSNGTYTVSLNDPGQTTTVSIKILAEKAADYTPGSAEYESYIKEYKFTVSRAKYDIATLDGLSFSLPAGVTGNISLDPSFDSDTTSYTLTLPEDENTIVVNPTVTPNVFIQHVKYNGITLNSGSNNSINITGKTNLEFVVTAQDGTTNTYTVALDKKSNDTSLATGYPTATLNKTDGTEAITLSQSGDIYTATVDYTGAEGFVIDAVANDPLAQVVFNPTSKEQAFSSSFAQETKSVTVTVTSQSGRTSTYTISITRQKADENVDFDYSVTGTSTGTSYSPEVNGNDWAYYLPESEGSATISISGLQDTTTATGTAIEGVTTLPIGNTRYTLKITPENTSKAVTYNIYIYKTLDKSNAITDIQILDSENGSPISDINFTFESDITSDHTYTLITVPYDVASVFIKATAASTATIYGNGSKSLLEGRETPITVYAQSEYDKRYNPSTYGYKHIITIKRTQADPDNSLESLKINGVEYISNGELTKTEIRVDRNASGTSVALQVEASLPTDSLAEILSTSTLGNQSVNNGSTFTVKVNVKSQSKDTRSYELRVVCKEDINTIDSITLKGTDKDGNEVAIPYTLGNTDVLEVAYKVVSATVDISTTAQYAVATGESTHSLTPSNTTPNTITVYLTSEYGTKGTEYVIKIKRIEADGKNLLDTLSFKVGGEEYITNFDPETENPISITLPNTIDTTVTTIGTVAATLPSGSFAEIISGLGEHTLPLPNGGPLNIPVIVQAQSTAKKTYLIIVTLEGQSLSDNANMASIQVKYGETDYLAGVTLDQIEAAGEAGYEIKLAYDVTGIQIIGTAESGVATVLGNDIKTLNPGDDFVVFVQAIAQNTNPGIKYYLHITVARPKQDAYLKELKFDGAAYADLSQTTSIVEIRVEHSQETITIDAIPCETAKINPSDLGVKSLLVGRNPFTITVIAQDSTVTNPITIIVYRCEDDATINSITISNTNYTFDAEATNPITINVDYTVTSVNVGINTTATYANLVGKGLNQLEVGPNEITVKVESEYYFYNSNKGKVSKEYKFIIDRAIADDNTYLSDLVVEIKGQPVEFDSPFYKEDQTYIIDNIAEDVTSIFINATPEKTTSTVSPTGNVELKDGSLTNGKTYLIVLKVTAQNGYTREYQLHVSRDKVNLDDNNDITSITIKGNDGNVYFQQEYNPIENKYSITVPYSVSTIFVTATKPLLAGSTIYGAEMYQLVEGESVMVTVYAVSENGDPGTKYKILVSREAPNSDSTLAYIKINGALVDAFSPTKFNYSKFVLFNTSEVDVTAAVATETSVMRITIDNQIHSGLKVQLQPDTQTLVQILVIAQSGAISTYNVTITRASADGALAELYIDGINFHDNKGNTITYSSEVKTYYATVTYAYENITICGSATDVTVEVRGIGTMPLIVGKQEFQVAAIPRTGNVTIYTIVVVRKAEATNNTNASSFNILEIDEFKSQYNNDNNIYDGYHVPSSVKKLTFDIKFTVGEFEDAPTYEVIGNELTFGKNAVIVVVTSPDLSTVRTIIVKVYRDDIEVKNASSTVLSQFATDFNNDVDSYSYNVGSNVKNIDLSFELANPNDDSVEISNTDLKVGHNTITITLKSGDDVNRVIYVNVYRAQGASLVDYCIGAGVVVVLFGVFLIFRRKKKSI